MQKGNAYYSMIFVLVQGKKIGLNFSITQTSFMGSFIISPYIGVTLVSYDQTILIISTQRHILN